MVLLTEDEMNKVENKNHTIPETNGSPLKIDTWKGRFLLERIIVRGDFLVLGGGNLDKKMQVLLLLDGEFLEIMREKTPS